MSTNKKRIEVKQANCFYNYTVGLSTTNISLTVTGMKLLTSGLARVICFSDLKCVYLDENRKPQIEWLNPKGRHLDNEWSVTMSEGLPEDVAIDLAMFLEFSFHEQHIEGNESKRTPEYFRAALPPIVLENEDMTLPLYPWVKMFSDGVMIISFQLDTSWDGLQEKYLISDLVNLVRRGFGKIWVHADIQKRDGEQLIPSAYEYDITIGGESIVHRSFKKTLNKMREESRLALDGSLAKAGRVFELAKQSWTLHEIAGTEKLDDWEGTMDLCRSMYITVLAEFTKTDKDPKDKQMALIWQGRPSVSLMRFTEQPNNKSDLIKKFGPSLSRVLTRVPEAVNPPELPPDLRLFEDFSFHANRSVFLWTWLRNEEAPENAWEDQYTKSMIFANQCRAEHFEYHNMRIVRACEIAKYPSSDNDLLCAYQVLATSSDFILHSSKAGEITDSLAYLLSATGTMGLIESGKEQARWRLDEIRYRNDKNRTNIDRWLAVLFGFVGVSGIAELVVQPLIHRVSPPLSADFYGLAAFIISGAVLVLISLILLFFSKRLSV